MLFAERNGITDFFGMEPGRLFKKVHYHECRSSRNAFCLQIATIGKFIVGVPIGASGLESLDNIESLSHHTINDLSHIRVKNIMRDALDRKQGRYENYERPSCDILKILLSDYANTELIIFRYGQKMKITEVIENSLKAVSNEIFIEVAVAVEAGDNENFISVKLSEFPRAEWYPVMGSIKAGNIYLKKPFGYFSNSYRMCFYNTLQHVKKHDSYKLQIKSTSESHLIQLKGILE